MLIEDREWYRAEYRERQAALRRQARRKLWFVRATIGVLFAIVFALAAQMLNVANIATNMRCSSGGISVLFLHLGGGCPGGAALRPRVEQGMQPGADLPAGQDSA